MFKSFSLTWLRKIANATELDRGWLKILSVLLQETELNLELTDIWTLRSGQFLDLQTQIDNDFWKQIFGLMPELLKSIVYTRKEELVNERVWDSEILEITNKKWAMFLKS